jgi:hypothetical protein
MRLRRFGPPPYEPDPTFDWKELRGESPDESEAYAYFLEYGQGSERTNRFDVLLEWKDVEALIGVFAKMDCPRAVRLERARQLADAVESLIKPPL